MALPASQPPAAPPRTSDAALPTRATVFMRTFLPWQLLRFAVINLKMLRLIRRSHG
jgi:hypothetical protein